MWLDCAVATDQRHPATPGGRADNAVYAVLFATIGTLLIVNQPSDDTGFVIFWAVVAYAAAGVLFFRAIVARR